jgi:hypothetical protein
MAPCKQTRKKTIASSASLDSPPHPTLKHSKPPTKSTKNEKNEKMWTEVYIFVQVHLSFFVKPKLDKDKDKEGSKYEEVDEDGDDDDDDDDEKEEEQREGEEKDNGVDETNLEEKMTMKRGVTKEGN